MLSLGLCLCLCLGLCLGCLLRRYCLGCLSLGVRLLDSLHLGLGLCLSSRSLRVHLHLLQMLLCPTVSIMHERGGCLSLVTYLLLLHGCWLNRGRGNGGCVQMGTCVPAVWPIRLPVLWRRRGVGLGVVGAGFVRGRRRVSVGSGGRGRMRGGG